MEKLTRQQYKEKLSIENLPNLIEDVVIRRARISKTPFARIILSGNLSIIIPEDDFNLFRKKDLLRVENWIKSGIRKGIRIYREGMFAGDTIVDETQIIPDNHWQVEAPALIEDSRTNIESWKECHRWEQYYLKSRAKCL